MVERYNGGQLPPAHPVADGRPPTPDGDRYPQPAPELPPPTTLAERWPILACAAVVVLAVLLGHLLR